MSFFAELKDVADIIDSTQMYLRDATAIEQAHQVLTFFGWQKQADPEHWVHPDAPGIRAILGTQGGKLHWRVSDDNGKLLDDLFAHSTGDGKDDGDTWWPGDDGHKTAQD